jgi:hypothetical protein
MAKPTKAEQLRRFIEAARQHGTDESPEAFERVFAKVVPPKLPREGSKDAGRRRSRVSKVERGVGKPPRGD